MFWLLFACAAEPETVSFADALPTANPTVTEEVQTFDDLQQEDFDTPCESAITYWNVCTGQQLEIPQCSIELEEQAALVLDLSCEELHYGAESLPLCELVNEGCDLENLYAERNLLVSEVHDLLTLTADRSESARDVVFRITEIEEIFGQIADRRGAFTTVYRPITARAITAVENNEFENTELSEELMIEFADRYLLNLRAHLLNMDPSRFWQRYYDLASCEECSVLRIAGVGINTHLIVDLPRTIAAIGAQDSDKEDFIYFGEMLLETTEQLIIDIDYRYDVDAGPLFRGFFVGEWTDQLLGTGTATGWAFQSIRRKAWMNGRSLQNPWRAWLAEAEINGSWDTADLILASLDHSNAI